jgi:hypothetical protein
MKKTRIIMAMMACLAIFGLASCNKTERQLIGTWEATSGTMVEGDGELEVVGSIWTFNSDNTCAVTADGITQSGTYTVKKDNLVINFEQSAQGMTVKTAFDMTVSAISSSDLTLEGTMSTTLSSSEGSYSDTSKIKVSFKKK